MRSNPYRYWLGTFALSASLCTGMSAHAADAGLACTGVLSVMGGGSPSIHCSDALTISSGSLSFDGALSLSAGTALSLIDATLVAPSFNIVAGTDFVLDAKSALNAGSGAINISAANFALEGGINAAFVALMNNTPIVATPWAIPPGSFGSVIFIGREGGDIQIPTLPEFHPSPWQAPSYSLGSGDATITIRGGVLGNALAVPEPSAWLMFVLGLVGITCKVGRRVWSA